MAAAGKPVRAPRKKVNPLHAKRIKEVDWKDVTLLRQFISDRGKIRARRVTGLTPQQQRQVAVAIRNAREMALLPYPRAGRG
jgi:small subunit ribosomal protein S18